MGLKEYFKNKKGFGVLSTADEKGRVDSAPYANPHVIDDTHVAFIMGDRLSHANIRKNPYAVYLFKEGWLGYKGKRLYLKREKESDDPISRKLLCQIITKASVMKHYCDDRYLKNSYIVYFKVESVLPLVGSK